MSAVPVPLRTGRRLSAELCEAIIAAAAGAFSLRDFEARLAIGLAGQGAAFTGLGCGDSLIGAAILLAEASA